ncbi:unnamed protein product [Blepharisma stoltei]|uniref:Uncharacterized protein n=1 Tax=Blepharisma stoltei TaxID=1481888 RepID=A0AAU9JNX6_9CILI|nr:unnamed protein product [Blepharisma stoltei]
MISLVFSEIASSSLLLLATFWVLRSAICFLHFSKFIISLFTSLTKSLLESSDASSDDAWILSTFGLVFWFWSVQAQYNNLH